MGINGWYLTGDDCSDSSYTAFSYTELNPVVSSTPVRNTNVREQYVSEQLQREKRSRRRPAKEAPVRTKPVRATASPKTKKKAKKKRTAAKVIFFVTGLAAVVFVSYRYKDTIVEACTDFVSEHFDIDIEIGMDTREDSVQKAQKKAYEEASERTDEVASYDRSDPAYEIAEGIMESLWRDNEIDTAWEICNWVHSNIYYQPVYDAQSFEDAAYMGFTRKSGDCFVSFACTKMLLDCAGIPNLMVERYPVETNSHYWNLVQIDGLWYHCDATVFKDHPDMYFLCTDDEIADSHHSFDSDLYPERAESYYWNNCDYEDVWYDDSYCDEEYYGDSYYDPYYDDGFNVEDGYYEGEYYYDEDLYYEDGYYEDRPYTGVNLPDEPYEVWN